jgi:hypothetical protein
MRVKVLRRLTQKCLQSPQTLAGGFVENPFFQFAGTLLFDKKKSAKVLHYFVLDCGLFDEVVKYSTQEQSSKRK